MNVRDNIDIAIQLLNEIPGKEFSEKIARMIFNDRKGGGEMKEMKIKTYGIEELNKRVQESLFRLGYRWTYNGKEINSSAFRRSINTWEDGTITHCGNDLAGVDSTEVTLQDLIDLPTPKVNPEPFIINLDEHMPTDEIHLIRNAQVIGKITNIGKQ